MDLLPGTTPKTFNLLSIGQRGVGKTVFLVGSYAELHGNSQQNQPGQVWFDCQDSKVQENIERLLSYITRTGQYPPSTLKITNFKFNLRRHSVWGDKTTSHFGWWDIPGESCNMDNPDFQRMVFNSSGCCVFIDAYALIYEPSYQQALEDIIQQVMPIATLVSLNSFKYVFALILTKCDLLKSQPSIQQKLNEGIQTLTSRLDALRVNYQKFYSDIPIVTEEGVTALKPTGAAAPLLWLLSQLEKTQPTSPKKTTNSLQSLLTPTSKASQVKKIFGLYLFPTTRRYILLIAIASIGLIGAMALLFVDYNRIFSRQPKNLEALQNLAVLEQRGQFTQAVTLMEKIVQQEPNRVDLRLHLAYLYELTSQILKAETTYDQVLAQQNNNITALVGKATIRKAQGDSKTAIALFAQAEKAAPEQLKAQIRSVAQKTLNSPAPTTPLAK